MLPAVVLASMAYFLRNRLPLGHRLSSCSILVGLLLLILVFALFFCSPPSLLPLPLLQMCLQWRRAAPCAPAGQFPAWPVLSGARSPAGPSSISQHGLRVQRRGALAWCLVNRLDK